MYRYKLKFTVSDNYKGADDSTVNTAKITNAQNAVKNAQTFAAANAGKSDYEKILAFRDEICRLTEYNYDALTAGTAYGDPWQLVYVFDGDPDTKVVCEGYSKAFQYLCDLSGIDCYTVSGKMSGGTGAGDHMWNIVVLDGASYLVDITNCDGEEGASTVSVGYPDKLLLKGAASSNGSTCTFSSIGMTYTYDDDTLALYPESILKVSTEDYKPSAAKPSLTAPAPVTVTANETVKAVLKSSNIASADSLKAESSDKKIAEAVISKFDADTGNIEVTVSGVSAGEATVKVTHTPESGTPITASFKVTVAEAECDHVWSDEWESDKTGHWHNCTKCDTGKSEVIAHTMTEVANTAKAPTCTENGKEADMACECGYKTEGKVVKALGHTPGEPVRENEKAPTCTEDGSYDMVTKCTECGFVIKTEHGVVPATGHHNFGELVQGEKTHYQECADCHIKVGEKPHTEDGGKVTARPTEAADGVRTYCCSVCGMEIRTEVIPALGEAHEHSYTILNSDAANHWYECVCGDADETTRAAHEEASKDEIVLEAVCNADGLKHVVTYCGDCNREISRTSVTIPKTGNHNAGTDYGKDSTGHWNTCTVCGTVVNKVPHEAGPAATEEAPQTCTVCGYVIAPMLEHSHTFSAEWKNDGVSHWHECESCGDRANIAAHVETSEVVKFPTDVAAGVRRYYCSICRYVLREEVIPATGTAVVPVSPPAAPVIPTWMNNNTALAEPILDNGSGKTGWKSIADDIRSAGNGSAVYVDMNGTTKLSKTVLRELAGKNVDLVLKMNDRITWTINGETVTVSKDVNMRAILNTDSIPQAVLEDYTDGNSIVQLTLSHRGNFGFDAVMTVDLGSRYNGKYANLMYYNQSSNKLEFIDCSLISDGKANLDFSHASEYAVVISNEPMGDYEDVSAAAGIYENDDSVPCESGIYAAVTAALAVSAAVVIFRKKVRK